MELDTLIDYRKRLLAFEKKIWFKVEKMFLLLV